MIFSEFDILKFTNKSIKIIQSFLLLTLLLISIDKSLTEALTTLAKYSKLLGNLTICLINFMTPTPPRTSNKFSRIS